MPDPSNFRLRVYFRKSGRCAMLSHLEVARALERAVRRAGLPYAISQGFSPHMKIAFGAALPVGVGGTRECFDLQMTRYIAPEKVADALMEASVPDLMVTSCEYIGSRDLAASVAYPISTYRVVLSDTPEHLDVPDEITVVRKKKEKILDPAEFLVGEIDQNKNILVFTLHAKPTGSLRPDVLLANMLDGDSGIYALSITRVEQRAV
ncbi:TIGR03936 family radical SAM-associated protein [Raoultibacter massiliensis]|uniref:TIGR03936 family radical SAM-associated protein n=1 Tax=Raoultibacter massiliensis TaxID=1852371 RepID=A0ABV1JCV5_9ACTN|nr:TIGR03936 family radical SAM-associated protein [Raoultibacter massiliensis]